MMMVAQFNAVQGWFRGGRWLIIAACALSGSVWGHYYTAPLNTAQWQVESGQFRCVLSHEVMDYGVARFVVTSGEPLWFEIETDNKTTQSGQASLMVQGPEWKSKVGLRHIDQTDFAVSFRPVVVHGETARVLLSELYAGMAPVVEHPGWYSHHPVRVELLPVRLMAAMRKFKRCQARLFEDSVLRAKRLKVNFEFDSYQLDTEARHRLDKLVEFLSLDPERYELVVRGHTDSRGDYGYNDSLSHKRAIAVQTYLNLKKAPRSRVELKYYGETKPLMPNDTDDNRRMNRRVEVILQQTDAVRAAIEEEVAKLDQTAQDSSDTPSATEQASLPSSESMVDPTLTGAPVDIDEDASPMDTLASNEQDDMDVSDDSEAGDDGPFEGPLTPIPWEESAGQSRVPIRGKIWAQ